MTPALRSNAPDASKRIVEAKAAEQMILYLSPTKTLANANAYLCDLVFFSRAVCMLIYVVWR